MTNKEIIDEAYHLGMMQNPYEIENALEFVKKLNIKNFMEIGTDQGGTFVCWSRVSDPKGLQISVDWAHGPWGKNTFNIQARNNKLSIICIKNLLNLVDGLVSMILKTPKTTMFRDVLLILFGMNCKVKKLGF